MCMNSCMKDITIYQNTIKNKIPSELRGNWTEKYINIILNRINETKGFRKACADLKQFLTSFSCAWEDILKVWVLHSFSF